MRRLLAVSLVAALLAVGCSDDEEPDPDQFAPTSAPELGPIAVAITPLAVTVRGRGDAPRRVLRQDLVPGTTSTSALRFDLRVEGVTAARVEGDTNLEVTDVDDEGMATVAYRLDGLDVAIAAEGEPADPIVDALDVLGELEVGPDRGVVAATVDTETQGDIPGIDGVAESLDPRLTSLLLPFPSEAVGVGARWTVQGPLPMFGATLNLTAAMQLVERRGNRYVVTAALSMETPTPGTGPDITLEGIGRLSGDLGRLGLRAGAVGAEGTIVIPDRGATPLPMSLQMRIGPP